MFLQHIHCDSNNIQHNFFIFYNIFIERWGRWRWSRGGGGPEVGEVEVAEVEVVQRWGREFIISDSVLLWARRFQSSCGPDAFSPPVGQTLDLLIKFAIATLFIHVIVVKMKSSTCVSAKRHK